MRTTVFLLALWAAVALVASCGSEEDRIATATSGVQRGDMTQLPAATPHVFGALGARTHGEEGESDEDLPDFDEIPPLVPPGYSSCDYVSSNCEGGCLVDNWNCEQHLEITIACCEHIGAGCRGYCVGLQAVDPEDQ